MSSSSGRLHRERSQPGERAHLGNLEKRRDYRQRADDFQKKQRRLQKLRRKALDKNQDEFHFHMINSHLKDGVHVDHPSEIDQDSILQKKIMDGHDSRYVRYRRDVETKKIEKMQSSLHLLDADLSTHNKHTIFVDTEKDAKNFNAAVYFDTSKDLMSRNFNRPKLSTLASTSIQGVTSKSDVLAIDRQRRSEYKELLKRQNRRRELAIVADKLQLKKHLTTSAGQLKPKRMRKGTNRHAAIYKWPYQRRR